MKHWLNLYGMVVLAIVSLGAGEADEFAYDRQTAPTARVVSSTRDTTAVREKLVIAVPGGDDITASLYLPGHFRRSC
jgi:hypothetical protein